MSIHDRLAALTEEVAGLNKKLNDQQQHWGHDKVDIEARQRSLLRNRLAPLLNDARDALEIDPQATHVALKRVKSALSVIEEAVTNSLSNSGNENYVYP